MKRIFAPFAEDVATALPLSWGIWDQAAARWLFHSPTPLPGNVEQGFPLTGWLVQCSDNWSHVDADELAQMVTEAVEIVQTAVMDELGHGWPEVSVGGAFAGLLSPEVASVDRPQIVWRLRALCCPAGGLAMLQSV